MLPAAIESALTQYQTYKAELDDHPAVAALLCLSKANQQNLFKIYECFSNNSPDQKDLAYNIYIAVLININPHSYKDIAVVLRKLSNVSPSLLTEKNYEAVTKYGIPSDLKNAVEKFYGTTSPLLTQEMLDLLINHDQPECIATIFIELDNAGLPVPIYRDQIRDYRYPFSLSKALCKLNSSNPTLLTHKNYKAVFEHEFPGQTAVALSELNKTNPSLLTQDNFDAVIKVKHDSAMTCYLSRLNEAGNLTQQNVDAVIALADLEKRLTSITDQGSRYELIQQTVKAHLSNIVEDRHLLAYAARVLNDLELLQLCINYSMQQYEAWYNKEHSHRYLNASGWLRLNIFHHHGAEGQLRAKSLVQKVNAAKDFKKATAIFFEWANSSPAHPHSGLSFILDNLVLFDRPLSEIVFNHATEVQAILKKYPSIEPTVTMLFKNKTCGSQENADKVLSNAELLDFLNTTNRSHFQQSFSRSCVAKAIMTLLVKIGKLRESAVCPAKELEIYKSIWEKPGGEADLEKTLQYLSDQGVMVELWSDSTKLNAVLSDALCKFIFADKIEEKASLQLQKATNLSLHLSENNFFLAFQRNSNNSFHAVLIYREKKKFICEDGKKKSQYSSFDALMEAVDTHDHPFTGIVIKASMSQLSSQQSGRAFQRSFTK